MLHSQLRSFHAVATEGGFTAAAKSINVGQPTISTQIKALEDAHGVTLFHRQGHNVMLSDCGKALLKISQRIFSREDEARELLVNYNGLRTGLLRVGAGSVISCHTDVGEISSRLPRNQSVCHLGELDDDG